MTGDVADIRARRGRPPHTAEQAEEVRARIVDGAATVFTAHGSRGLSVARIIHAAGISRPTFYRYFGNAEGPLHVLLTASNNGLVDGIRNALGDVDDPVAMGIGLIDAYLDWARSHGPMLRPVFAELHDPGSPVSAYRVQALDGVRALVRDRFTALGRPHPDLLNLDTALQVCEFCVYRVTTDLPPDTEPTTEAVATARLTMIRSVLATLGDRTDIERALEIPGLFDR